MPSKNTFLYVIFVLKFYSHQTSKLTIQMPVIDAAWIVNPLKIKSFCC